MEKRDLHCALDNKELEMHYQPQWSTRAGGLAGIEALIRWPRRVGVSPEIFVPEFEAAGLAGELAAYTLNQVCEDIGYLLADGKDFGHVGVNYSYSQLVAANALDQMESIVHAKSIPPIYLMIELTESERYGDLQMLSPQLDRLSDHGFHFALDDFCTGFSTVEHMCNLPVDAIKIDKSYVARLGELKFRVIVEQIVGMAVKTGVCAIAEGVEEMAQVRQLNELGCHLMQGYYYAKPMPFPDLVEYCQQQGTCIPHLAVV